VTSLRRLAHDAGIVVRDGDAVVLHDGAEVVRVPGAGPAAGWLTTASTQAWDRQWYAAAPPAVRRLIAALEAHQVVVGDPLAEHLIDLHARTVRGHLDPPAVPGVDAGFLAREAGTGPAVALPPPDLGAAPLAGALRARHSARTFGRGSVRFGALATLLGAAAGTTGRDGDPDRWSWPAGPPRRHPSGGALYPIETHVVTVWVEHLPSATYRYLPLAHALSRRAAAPSPVDLAQWIPDLPAGDTAAVVLLCMDLARPSLRRYGGKAYRLALLEAGHIAQNLVLVATALGLAGRPLCGFDDEALAAAAGLAYPAEVVVYAVGFGAAPADRRT
jgi:SagB-type dehydrogenase family enzyme